jgi:hypothetical protein
MLVYLAMFFVRVHVDFGRIKAYERKDQEEPRMLVHLSVFFVCILVHSSCSVRRGARWQRVSDQPHACVHIAVFFVRMERQFESRCLTRLKEHVSTG